MAQAKSSEAPASAVIQANVDRFLGGASGYHTSRPTVPAVAMDIITRAFLSAQATMHLPSTPKLSLPIKPSAPSTTTTASSTSASAAAVSTKPNSLSRPRVVVDLGCGTGLSTVGWSQNARAEQVIGIEPNQDMLCTAREAYCKPSPSTESDSKQQSQSQPQKPALLSFQSGSSTQTGLKASSIDIVTVSQALHWMV